MFGNAPQGVVVQGNVRRHPLRPDEYQSYELLFDLGNLPRHSNNKDRLRICKEWIRTWKYLGKKLLPPH